MKNLYGQHSGSAKLSDLKKTMSSQFPDSINAAKMEEMFNEIGKYKSDVVSEEEFLGVMASSSYELEFGFDSFGNSVGKHIVQDLNRDLQEALMRAQAAEKDASEARAQAGELQLKVKELTRTLDHQKREMEVVLQSRHTMSREYEELVSRDSREKLDEVVSTLTSIIDISKGSTEVLAKDVLGILARDKAREEFIETLSCNATKKSQTLWSHEATDEHLTESQFQIHMSLWRARAHLNTIQFKFKMKKEAVADLEDKLKRTEAHIHNLRDKAMYHTGESAFMEEKKRTEDDREKLQHDLEHAKEEVVDWQRKLDMERRAAEVCSRLLEATSNARKAKWICLRDSDARAMAITSVVRRVLKWVHMTTSETVPSFAVGERVRIVKPGSTFAGTECEVAIPNWQGQVKVRVEGLEDPYKSYLPEQLERIGVPRTVRDRCPCLVLVAPTKKRLQHLKHLSRSSIAKEWFGHDSSKRPLKASFDASHEEFGHPPPHRGHHDIPEPDMCLYFLCAFDFSTCGPGYPVENARDIMHHIGPAMKLTLLLLKEALRSGWRLDNLPIPLETNDSKESLGVVALMEHIVDEAMSEGGSQKIDNPFTSRDRNPAVKLRSRNMAAKHWRQQKAILGDIITMAYHEQEKSSEGLIVDALRECMTQPLWYLDHFLADTDPVRESLPMERVTDLDGTVAWVAGGNLLKWELHSAVFMAHVKELKEEQNKNQDSEESAGSSRGARMTRSGSGTLISVFDQLHQVQIAPSIKLNRDEDPQPIDHDERLDHLTSLDKVSNKLLQKERRATKAFVPAELKGQRVTLDLPKTHNISRRLTKTLSLIQQAQLGGGKFKHNM